MPQRCARAICAVQASMCSPGHTATNGSRAALRYCAVILVFCAGAWAGAVLAGAWGVHADVGVQRRAAGGFRADAGGKMTKAENRKARACTLPNGSRRRAGYRRGPVFMLCGKRVKMQRSLQLKIIRAEGGELWPAARHAAQRVIRKGTAVVKGCTAPRRVQRSEPSAARTTWEQYSQAGGISLPNSGFVNMGVNSFPELGRAAEGAHLCGLH